MRIMLRKYRFIKRPRYYYGWNIVGMGYLSTVISGLGVYTLTLFIRPMVETFGWSRGAISLVSTIQTAGNGLFAPFIGPILDARGPRILMVTGAVLSGLSFILTSKTKNLLTFYLYRGVLFSLGMTLVGPFVSATTISKFFIQKRGRAIAISALGLSSAGIVLPPIAANMIDTFGWQFTWLVLGLVIWCIAIIPPALIMRKSPEDLGLNPDGLSDEELRARLKANTTNEAWASEGAQWNRQLLMKSKSFWFIVIAFGLSSAGMQGIFLHMLPLIEERGFSRMAAAGAFTAQNFVAFIFKPIWGMIAERSIIRYATAIEFAFGGIGLLGVFLTVQFTNNIAMVYICTGIIGISIGGVVVNHELIWGNSFGRQNLGLVRGTGQPFTIVASAIGPLLGGILYDSTNSYSVAMPLYVMFYFIAIVAILFARPPTYKKETD